MLINLIIIALILIIGLIISCKSEEPFWSSFSIVLIIAGFYTGLCLFCFWAGHKKSTSDVREFISVKRTIESIPAGHLESGVGLKAIEMNTWLDSEKHDNESIWWMGLATNDDVDKLEPINFK